MCQIGTANIAEFADIDEIFWQKTFGNIALPVLLCINNAALCKNLPTNINKKAYSTGIGVNLCSQAP